MAKPPIFLSFDIEADGPAPTVNNCLQIGIVACLYDQDPDPVNHEKWVMSELDLCLQPQPNRTADPDTMESFWSKFPETLAKIEASAGEASLQMARLTEWLNELEKTFTITKWVAKPAGYDWQWLNGTYHQYSGPGAYPLPHKCECISSLIRALEYIGVDRKILAEFLDVGSETMPHTHYALDDALEQAYKYLRLRKYMKQKVTINGKS